MQALTVTLFLVAAIINLLPGLGALSPERMESTYGVALRDPTLATLMRHRAVAIAIVGALLAAAAFQPSLRTAATVAGLASMLSFMLLVALAPEPQPSLRGIWIADVVGAIALVAGALLDRATRGAA